MTYFIVLILGINNHGLFTFILYVGNILVVVLP